MNGIRDPVHGWIEYTASEHDIIDSPLFQRLRWVSQLNGAMMVFPGGTNNRFIHSMGAMHLAGKYFDSLVLNDMPSPILDRKLFYRSLVRVAALLHDIGHGAFSHAYDSAIYSQIYSIPDGGHDRHRQKIVHSDLIAPYIRSFGLEPDDIIALWDRRSEAYCKKSHDVREILDVLRPLIQGPLGADRMDFTLRDSYFMGTTHFGTISSDRIISNAVIMYKEGVMRLCYRTKCITDIIAALESRFYMYENIYLHRTVCAASILIERMMSSVTDDLQMIARTHDIHQFAQINDSTLIGEIMASSVDTSKMKYAKENLLKLLYRHLPKLVREYRVEDGEEAPSIILESNQSLHKTRPINGMDPTAFDKANIYFVSNKPTLQFHTCGEVLSQIHYSPSRKPFYFLRVYSDAPASL